MKVVSIVEIQEKIRKYINDNLYQERKIDNYLQQNNILEKLYGHNYSYHVDKSNIIMNFKEVIFDDFSFISFTEYSQEKKSLRQHLILANQNKIVSEIIEHNEFDANSLITTTSYFNYNSEINHLTNKLVVKQVLNNQKVIMSHITLLGLEDDAYYKKDYEFIYQNSKPTVIKMENNYYVKGNNGFENRLDVCNKMIDRHADIFKQSWNAILADPEVTHVYQIKRKIRS